MNRRLQLVLKQSTDTIDDKENDFDNLDFEAKRSLLETQDGQFLNH
ncbi:435_t:CDS:1, partial [Gigaspora rosea]